MPIIASKLSERQPIGPSYLTDYLKTCERAARAGGQVLLDWIGKIAAREKGPGRPGYEADIASQEEIRRIVLSNFPDHAFLGEEGGAHGAQADAEYPLACRPA